jgi:hypothetical protein
MLSKVFRARGRADIHLGINRAQNEYISRQGRFGRPQGGDFVSDVRQATERRCLTDAAPNEPQGRLADGPAGDLQFALTEDQDFRVATTLAA